jgi:hypothetical protein
MALEFWIDEVVGHIKIYYHLRPASKTPVGQNSFALAAGNGRQRFGKIQRNIPVSDSGALAIC